MTPIRILVKKDKKKKSFVITEYSMSHPPEVGDLCTIESADWTIVSTKELSDAISITFPKVKMRKVFP